MCQNVPCCDFSTVDLFWTQPDCQTSPAFSVFLSSFSLDGKARIKDSGFKGKFFLTGDGLKRLFLRLDVYSLVSFLLVLSLFLLLHLELQMNNMQCSLNSSTYLLLHLSACLLVLIHISWPKSPVTVKMEGRALSPSFTLTLYTRISVPKCPVIKTVPPSPKSEQKTSIYSI